MYGREKRRWCHGRNYCRTPVLHRLRLVDTCESAGDGDLMIRHWMPLDMYDEAEPWIPSRGRSGRRAVGLVEPFWIATIGGVCQSFAVAANGGPGLFHVESIVNVTNNCGLLNSQPI